MDRGDCWCFKPSISGTRQSSVPRWSPSRSGGSDIKPPSARTLQLLSLWRRKVLLQRGVCREGRVGSTLSSQSALISNPRQGHWPEISWLSQGELTTRSTSFCHQFFSYALQGLPRSSLSSFPTRHLVKKSKSINKLKSVPILPSQAALITLIPQPSYLYIRMGYLMLNQGLSGRWCE